MPAHAAPLNPYPASASQRIACAEDGVTVVPTALFGWSLAESTGAATAKVRLRDGATVAGPVLAVITLAANESARDWFGEQTIQLFNGGIYLEVVSGSVEGAVLWG